MKSQVNPTLVNLMAKFYGSVEAARNAYRVVRNEVKAHNDSPKAMLGGKVVWVTTAGQIVSTYAAAVFYDRSPDAAFVLPS